MVRLISRQRGGLAALKLTKLFGINDFPAAKHSGKVLIIIIYCYLIINIIIDSFNIILKKLCTIHLTIKQNIYYLIDKRSGGPLKFLKLVKCFCFL